MLFKNNIVSCYCNNSVENEIMRQFRLHTIFVDITAFVILTFSTVTDSYNWIIARAFDFSKVKIRVLNDLISLLSSRLAENNLCLYLQLHMINLGNVDSSQPSSGCYFNNVLVLKQREL